MNTQLIIPSMSRAETMTTHKLLTGSNYLVCVPESQAKDYIAKVGEEHVLAHPENMGKMPKMNWCFDRFQEPDAIIFFDDDILSVFRCWRSRISDETESSVTDPEFVLDLIAKTATMSAELGAKVFGWSNSARHAVFYTGFRPFRLTGFVNGRAVGFLKGHGLRYDERLIGKGDYDMCMQNALKHRYCFVDQRFAFHTSPPIVGGGAPQRTIAIEKETMRLLRVKWGDCIQVMSTSKGKDARLNRKLRSGMENIFVKLPF